MRNSPSGRGRVPCLSAHSSAILCSSQWDFGGCHKGPRRPAYAIEIEARTSFTTGIVRPRRRYDPNTT
jgi:hypothetical protein